MLDASSELSSMLITLGHRLLFLSSLSVWSTAGSSALYPATDAVNNVRSSVHPLISNNGFQCLLRQGRNMKAAEKGQHTIGLISREWRSSIPIAQKLSALNLCLYVHTYRPGTHQYTHVKTCSKPRNIAALWVVYKNPHCCPGANDQKRQYVTATSASCDIPNTTD